MKEEKPAICVVSGVTGVVGDLTGEIGLWVNPPSLSPWRVSRSREGRGSSLACSVKLVIALSPQLDVESKEVERDGPVTPEWLACDEG